MSVAETLSIQLKARVGALDLDIEQRPCAAPEDRSFILVRNRERTHLSHAVIEPHVEWIIAAQQNARSTGILDQKFER